jgi:hypothetical protein
MTSTTYPSNYELPELPTEAACGLAIELTVWWTNDIPEEAAGWRERLNWKRRLVREIASLSAAEVAAAEDLADLNAAILATVEVSEDFLIATGETFGRVKELRERGDHEHAESLLAPLLADVSEHVADGVRVLDIMDGSARIEIHPDEERSMFFCRGRGFRCISNDDDSEAVELLEKLVVRQPTKGRQQPSPVA